MTHEMPKKLFKRFLQTTLEFPEKIALITERSQMSFSDLKDLVQVLDIQLSQYGVQKGQIFALTTKRAEFVLAFAILASLRNFTLVYATDGEIINGGLNVDRIIGMEESQLFDRSKQIIIQPDWFDLMNSLPSYEWKAEAQGEGAFVTTTSGSTGKPKFIKLSEFTKLSDMAEMRRHSVEELRSMRYISTAQTTASISLNTNIPVLLAGGTVISVSEQLSSVLQLSDLWRASHMTATPGIIKSALKLRNPAQFLTCLREIAVLGAQAPHQLLKRLSEVTSARLVAMYGASETGALISEVFDANAPVQAGRLGRLFRSDVEIGFCDKEGKLDPSLDKGEVIVSFLRPDQRQYLGGAKDETDLQNKYFKPGDILRREDDVYYYVGRKTLILNQHGNKYSLEAIEQALTATYKKMEFCAVPIIDDQNMESLCICYVGSSELSLVEVQSLLTRRWKVLELGKLKRIPEMPLTSNGKLDRQKLRNV